jgi:hypothetical protein
MTRGKDASTNAVGFPENRVISPAAPSARRKFRGLAHFNLPKPTGSGTALSKLADEAVTTLDQIFSSRGFGIDSVLCIRLFVPGEDRTRGWVPPFCETVADLITLRADPRTDPPVPG